MISHPPFPIVFSMRLTLMLSALLQACRGWAARCRDTECHAYLYDTDTQLSFYREIEY